MRNQPIPACKGNVLYAGIQRSSAGDDASLGCGCGGTAEPDLPRRGDWPGDPWARHHAARPQGPSTRRHCPSASSRELHPKECGTERSVLAEPTFVFEKKDRPLKRPAEDPVGKAENDSISSRKRARSSSFTLQKSDSQSNTDTTLTQKRGRSFSFTILPTFPPSQPLQKNNIFMTSALLQRKPDLIKSKNKGSLSQSQLRNIIRPAILQPSQVLTCPDNPVVTLVSKKEACIQLSEDSSYSSTENSVSSKTAARSSTTMNLPSSKTTQSQLFEDRSVQTSGNSDFVFGKNMVERVLSPEKHLKPCNESDSYKGEITSMYLESFHVSPQTKTALRNATLIETAAAFISKPVEKILLDKVEVITGEEAEHNVLQITCKLFVFNKLSLSWIERGRGSLRLNDTSSNKCRMLQSRLIMRNQGSLRLILNTRLWDQMVVRRANRKSLCFTATDQEDHSVQVFLIQASSKDTGYLYAAIHHRLVALRSFAQQEPDANQVDTESEIAFQPLNCDSDDEDDEKVTQVSSSGSVLKTQSLCKSDSTDYCLLPNHSREVLEKSILSSATCA
ncbi:ran-binding protein 3-like [Podargus strigoides]